MTSLRIIVGVLGISYIVLGFIGTIVRPKMEDRIAEFLRTLALIGLTYYVWFG